MNEEETKKEVWPFSEKQVSEGQSDIDKEITPPALDPMLVRNHYELRLCLNKKQAKNALKELGVKKSQRPNLSIGPGDAFTCEFRTKKSGPCIIIFLGDVSELSKIEIYSILVHEAVHVWQFNCDYIGENYPSPEFEAYSIAAIVENLFNAYEEATKQCEPTQ